MSDLVDWGSPAPAPTSAPEGTPEEVSDGVSNNSDSTDQKSRDTREDTSAEAREMGLQAKPDDRAVEGDTDTKPAPGKGDTDTKRPDIQKPKEKVKPEAPRLINVNGEMISEEELITRASRATGADKRFEEAARVRKQQQAFMEKLTSDPLAVLADSRINIDRKALGEKLLLEELERESADPRDVELDRYRSQEAERAKQEEIRAEQEKEEELQRQIQQKKTEVSDIIGKAMKDTILSKNPQIASQVLREMAMHMRAARQQGIDVTPDELVQHVESSRFAGFHMMANSLEGEELIEFMGKDVVAKIRRADLKRLKGTAKSVREPSNRTSSDKKPGKKGKPQDPYEAMRKAFSQ